MTPCRNICPAWRAIWGGVIVDPYHVASCNDPPDVEAVVVLDPMGPLE